MIVTRIKPGRPPKEIEIRRFECAVCGQHYDAVDVGDRDKVDHHCKTKDAGAWWIVRRAA